MAKSRHGGVTLVQQLLCGPHSADGVCSLTAEFDPERCHERRSRGRHGALSACGELLSRKRDWRTGWRTRGERGPRNRFNKRAGRFRVASPTSARTRRPGASALQARAVVELLDLDRAVRRSVEAELAQHALVDVLVHDLDQAVVAGAEDVHGAHLLEPRGDLGVPGDGVVHRDVDEDPVQGHRTTAPRRSLTASGISSMRSTTRIPAPSSRAIFCAAVSSSPSTIVPACPKLIPFISSSSMNLPAMKATIGSRESFSVTHSASWASMRPPGSV